MNMALGSETGVINARFILLIHVSGKPFYTDLPTGNFRQLGVGTDHVDEVFGYTYELR